MKSNITIAPNIYVRSTPNLQNDEEFVKSVYGFRALNTLKSRFPKSYSSRLTRAQIEEMKQNVICRLSKTREHAYGKAVVDGKTVWSCRCENEGCYAYEKCMRLPNAVQIDRTGIDYTAENAKFMRDNANASDPASTETPGFDYDECSFEPPHVTVVLPILSQILSESEENRKHIDETVQGAEKFTEPEKIVEPVKAEEIPEQKPVTYVPHWEPQRDETIPQAAGIASVASVEPAETVQSEPPLPQAESNAVNSTSPSLIEEVAKSLKVTQNIDDPVLAALTTPQTELPPIESTPESAEIFNLFGNQDSEPVSDLPEPEPVTETDAHKTAEKERENLSVRYVLYPFMAEKCEFDANERSLVICESVCEAEYFSTILYKNKIKHRLLCSDGYTLNRKIADVFWDYCGEEIERDAFMDRCFVRLGCGDDELNELYTALYTLCGDAEIGDFGGLRVTDLADALNRSPELISNCMLNIDDIDVPVTISTVETLTANEEYDEIMILEGVDTLNMHSNVEEMFGTPPVIIQKETASGWLFSTSALGRPCRVGLDNYKGEAGTRCLNVQLGLYGDIDGKNFLSEQTGDSLRLQLYIAEKINAGDELTVEKDSDKGGYRFFHNGNMLGEFPDVIIREMRNMDGFPADDFTGFEGVFVKSIVTIIADKNDPNIPARFRDSRIWLGLDITGYAKVKI